MVAGITLTEFTSLFLTNNYKKWWYNSKLFYEKCLKMTECNTIECNSYETHNIYPNLGVPLNDQQHFSLKKINEIKDYFVAEMKERELIAKLLVTLSFLLTILISH